MTTLVFKKALSNQKNRSETIFKEGFISQAHQGAIYCIEANKENVFTASEDRAIRIWDKSGKKVDEKESNYRIYTLSLSFAMSISLSSTSLFSGGGLGVANFDLEKQQETHRFEVISFGANIESAENQVYALLNESYDVVAQLDFRSGLKNTLCSLPDKSFGHIQVLDNKVLVDCLGEVWITDIRTATVLTKIPVGSPLKSISALYATGDSIFAGKVSGDIYQIES